MLLQSFRRSRSADIMLSPECLQHSTLNYFALLDARWYEPYKSNASGLVRVSLDASTHRTLVWDGVSDLHSLRCSTPHLFKAEAACTDCREDGRSYREYHHSTFSTCSVHLYQLLKRLKSCQGSSKVQSQPNISRSNSLEPCMIITGSAATSLTSWTVWWNTLEAH